MPATHDTMPQCWTMNDGLWTTPAASVTLSPTPWANVRNHLRMPWRRKPEQPEMNAIVRITRLETSRLMITHALSGGPSSPLDASATSKLPSPASAGVSRTHTHDATNDSPIRIAGPMHRTGNEPVAVRVRTSWPPMMSTSFGAQSYARLWPSEIKNPKKPPNVPRSRRWNHDALTFTIDTAPNDWKYMFTALRTSSTVTDGTVWSFHITTPIARFATAAPAAASSIVNRPPSMSHCGPFTRNARPYVIAPTAAMSPNSLPVMKF